MSKPTPEFLIKIEQTFKSLSTSSHEKHIAETAINKAKEYLLFWYKKVPFGDVWLSEETSDFEIGINIHWFIEGCDINVTFHPNGLINLYAKQIDENDHSDWTNWEEEIEGEEVKQGLIDVYEMARRTYG